MAEPTFPVRTSRRKRARNKKYTDDAFDGLDIADSSESDPRASEPRAEVEDDEDFTLREGVEEATEAEEDSLSVDGASEAQASADDGSDAGDDLIDDTVSIVASDVGKRRHGGTIVGGTLLKQRRKESKGSEGLHSRGLMEIRQHSAKDVRLMNVFGSGEEDLRPVLQAQERWYAEPTLPSRVADEHGRGGMAMSYFFTANMRSREATVGSRWFFQEGGKELFKTKQNLSGLEEEEGKRYLPPQATVRHDFLIGPNGRQMLFSLHVGASMNVCEAWSEGQAYEGTSNGHQVPNKEQRNGCVLYIGSKIHCIEWVPHQSGATQFLAVSVLPHLTAKQFDCPRAPAYTAAPSSPASIQVWSFAGCLLPGGQAKIDYSRSPELRIVLCTDWGDVRQFKFNHFLSGADTGLEESEAFREASLGLLAGLWGDGKVRVIDVGYRASAGGRTQYIRIEKAAFEAGISDTVCTCLNWLSSSDIVVGHANGTVAIYNLAHLISPPSFSPSNSSASGVNPRPWFHASLSTTYILTVTSAYPSRPYLLLSSSASGHLRLTDIRSPHSDSVFSYRSRIGASILQWSDHVQSAISPDDNYNLRAYPARRFFSSFALARLTSTVTSLAVSLVHPFILAGTADGGFYATNPTRRLLDSRVPIYQQLLFQHEWSRLSPAYPPPRGISRITEGYKAQQALGAGQKQEGRQFQKLGGKTKVGDGSVFATVHEEKSAMTVCAWNPNLHVGGWAAIGMGCGLLRVQDLACDE